MKVKSINLVYPLHPVFNPSRVPLFESFDSEHSTILWSSLYLNAVEVLSSDNSGPVCIIDEADVDFIPESIKGKDLFYTVPGDRETTFKNLNDKYFRKQENNILFFSNSMGYTWQDINKTINLLGINDDALVLAKSFQDKVCFTGFNKYEGFLNTLSIEYNEILAHSCRSENFIFTLDNFISVNSKDDFKKLYQELSKRESLVYCSQEMHERFTHLFIEYKDILK